jgi:hypothetical protein
LLARRYAPKRRLSRSVDSPSTIASAAPPQTNGDSAKPVAARAPSVPASTPVGAVAVPDNEIGPESCPLIVKLVDVECGPGVCGMNAYVNAHDALAANVIPAQF